MFGPVRAVAVDDEPRHLLSITSGLSAIGIPCTGYWFDRDTNALRPQPPAGGLPYLRILFTDLNLAELGGVPDTQSLWAAVVNVIKQLLSKDSGPYLLVFWTRVGAKAAEVKEMLYARAEQLEGIPCPIEVLEMSKAEFLVDGPNGQGFDEGLREFYGALYDNIERLRESVANAVAADANLNVVSAWETRAANAAALAVNEIHRCARSDVVDPLHVSESLGKVMAKIAVAAAGTASAQTEPARAFDAGMVDILVDQLGASVEADSYKTVVNTAIGTKVAGDIQFTNSVSMHAELNTFFQVEREVSTVKSWDRGVVVPARPPLNGNVLGFNTRELIDGEFLFPPELFGEGERDEIRTLLQEFKRSAEVVLVEVGADCDHAQDHDRTRRYLVGLEVPDRFVRLARAPEGGGLRNGSLEFLGPWMINDAPTYLLISCRRFWTWQRRNPPDVQEIRYRLRASLVDKLLHRYSTWSSRPGIVEFR